MITFLIKGVFVKSTSRPKGGQMCITFLVLFNKLPLKSIKCLKLFKNIYYSHFSQPKGTSANIYCLPPTLQKPEISFSVT